MRLILHNPHVEIWYKTPLYHAITKRKSVEKYSFLIDYCVESKIDFAFYIDKLNSSIPNQKFRRLIPPMLEFFLWTLINRINPFAIKVITDISNLKGDDIIFSFIYGNFTIYGNKFNTTPELVIQNLAKTKAYKAIHLTHFMYNISLGARNIKDANVDLFIAENNLFKNSGFFRHYFPWYTKNVYAMPFVFKERFKNTTPFSNRKNKAIATGTITFMMDDKDFVDYFHHTKVHPMRSEIYFNQGTIRDQIDSYISDITEGKKIIPTKKTDNPFKKLYVMFYHDFFFKQKKYFSFDIVQKYNEYKMFIVPEEVNDLPGIGFVEGMACGSAYLGISDPMYKDIGLIDGIHYIGYNGTLPDLIEMIKYYQNHPDKLEKIANQGCEYVRSNFNGKTVAEKLIKDLQMLIEARQIKADS
jgi:hypothetical protein